MMTFAVVTIFAQNWKIVSYVGQKMLRKMSHLLFIRIGENFTATQSVITVGKGQQYKQTIAQTAVQK